MPIGTPTDAYAAAFHGKGNTISNLTISFTAAMGNAGLFDILGRGGVIRDGGMITPNLQCSGSFLGTLAGSIASGAEVRSSYVQGGAITATGGIFMGGLVGGNSDAIKAGYSTADVIGGSADNIGAGGLGGVDVWDEGRDGGD